MSDKGERKGLQKIAVQLCLAEDANRKEISENAELKNKLKKAVTEREILWNS